jgi:hypothetical protein
LTPVLRVLGDDVASAWSRRRAHVASTRLGASATLEQRTQDR